MRGKGLSELMAYKLTDTQRKLRTSTLKFQLCARSSRKRNIKLTSLDIHSLVGMKFLTELKLHKDKQSLTNQILCHRATNRNKISNTSLMPLQSSLNDKTLKSNYLPVLPVMGNNFTKWSDHKTKLPNCPASNEDTSLAKTKPKYKIS